MYSGSIPLAASTRRCLGLITSLARAWSQVTAEPVDGFAPFLQEVPGAAVMEYGEILPEAQDD